MKVELAELVTSRVEVITPISVLGSRTIDPINLTKSWDKFRVGR
jgi:hypothetical protein